MLAIWLTSSAFAISLCRQFMEWSERMPRKSTDMHASPEGITRLRTERRTGADFDDRTGAMIRTLAATTPNGVILALGTDHPESAIWLLDGMDITTRLVVLVEDREHVAGVNRDLTDDIRLAVHAQHVDDFLADIKSHRMDMVLCDSELPGVETFNEVLSLISPGGVLLHLGQYIGAPSQRVGVHAYLRGNREFHSVVLQQSPQLLLAVRRATVPPAGRRRRVPSSARK